MIKVLSESESKVLGVQASKKLTDDDYEDVRVPKLEEILAAHHTVRCLLYMDEKFEGWETSALWQDTKFCLEHAGTELRGGFEKIAMVGGPAWAGKAAEFAGYLMPGEMKAFSGDELADAWTWVKN